jgi:signal transduction histidine kinase
VTVRRAAGVVAGAVAIAAACELAAGADLPAAAGDAAAGAALLGAGALTAGGIRGRRSGLLMVASGIAWLAGTISGPLVFIHRGPLVQLVLAYPRARPLGAVAVAVTVAAYPFGASGTLARSTAVTLALAAMVLLAAAERHRAAAGTQRRAATTALAAASVLALAFAAPAIARSLGGGVDAAALWVYDGAVVLIAFGLAADLRWGRWAHAAVAELVADLGSLQGPDGPRERLARALGDPDLALAFGATPPAGVAPGRVVTDIVDDGRRVGVLVHDPAVADDPQLLDAAISVARLAAANARLQREVAGAVGEVAASRRRLVEATIDQRRRLETELRDGPERRLAGIADRLDRLAASGELPQLTEVTSGLARARDDLRRFAQGVHPRALTEDGLAAALEEIADTMPLPVHLDVARDRLAPNAEAAAYFLCAEALANVGKHAHATSVTIAVRRDDTALDVAISDDGAGGADPGRGSGLRGLADRIHALDGDFQVDSHDGRGTRLHARIPL